MHVCFYADIPVKCSDARNHVILFPLQLAPLQAMPAVVLEQQGYGFLALRHDSCAGAGASATINQSCAFLVSNEAFLDISVVNHNMITSHSVIGSARVGLENVLKSGTETLEVHVTDQKNYGAGTVELRLEMDKVTHF